MCAGLPDATNGPRHAASARGRLGPFTSWRGYPYMDLALGAGRHHADQARSMIPTRAPKQQIDNFWCLD